MKGGLITAKRRNQTNDNENRDEKGVKMSRTMSTTKGRKRVTFVCDAAPGSEVYLAGTFNGWNPRKKRLEADEGGTYSCTCLLPKGTHEYKFIVDGEWRIDERNPESTTNEHGSRNSVIHLQ